MIVSRRMRVAFIMLIVPTLSLVAFEIINLCVSDALAEFFGAPFESLLISGAVFFGIIALIVLGVGFHCPRCGKRILDLPPGTLLKKGFFYPQARIFGIIFGKPVECLFCGWKDDETIDEVETSENSDEEIKL